MKGENALMKEFNYFLDHQDELVKQYDHRYIVIIGDKVVGDYDTFYEAAMQSAKEYPVGTFLVQLCIAGEEAYTQRFNRVHFS
jgi:hypothetical protein